MLQHTVKHCNTLQHTCCRSWAQYNFKKALGSARSTWVHCITVIHCNTLQHTATHSFYRGASTAQYNFREALGSARSTWSIHRVSSWYENNQWKYKNQKEWNLNKYIYVYTYIYAGSYTCVLGTRGTWQDLTSCLPLPPPPFSTYWTSWNLPTSSSHLTSCNLSKLLMCQIMISAQM